ncbi:MAG: GTP-binding protein [Aquificae bacterium]|nr:GTP-binding protein [Aquificota bacterium]
MKEIKILVAGHFNAGKSTFVKSATRGRGISIERETSAPEERVFKKTTTVAMDFGTSHDELHDVKVAVFGIPGQERFSFMWKILARNADGYVFLLDSTRPDMWDSTLKQIEFFMKENPAPYIICANKQDLDGAYSVEQIRRILNVDPSVPVLPCVATDEEVVKQIISILVERIMKESRKFQEVKV